MEILPVGQASQPCATRRYEITTHLNCFALSYRQSGDVPRQLWTEPNNTVAANREIRWIEDGRLYEVRHHPIDLRPLRLHEVEHEFRRSVSALVHDPDCRVVSVGNHFDPQLGFEDRIGVIEDRVDRVRGVAIAGQMKWRRALLNLAPAVGNWSAARSAPFNRRTLPSAEISRGAVGLQGPQFGNCRGRFFIETRERSVSSCFVDFRRELTQDFH